jgi:hypothetical protein
MRPPKVVFVPQLAVWLLRLATSTDTRGLLLADAVVFANWYASAHELLEWPAAVTETQTAERARKLTLENTMELLAQLNSGLAERSSAARARELLEGYAVHEWVCAHRIEFDALAQAAHTKYAPLEKLAFSSFGGSGPSGFDGLAQLCEALELGSLEANLLAFTVLCSAADDLAHLIQHFSEYRWSAGKLWTALFDTTPDKLNAALRPTGALRLSGLLQPSHRRGAPASLSTFWVDLLTTGTSLLASVVEPLDGRRGAGTPARMMQEDLALAASVVRNTENLPGVNLLLYGAAQLDKRQLLKDVVERAGRRAFRVKKLEDAGRGDRPSLVYVAQKLLAREHPDAVLVVERPADALSTAPSEMLRALFGVEFDQAESKPFDENLLASNLIPCIWTASSVASLPDETVARFVFHAPLKKADRKDRILQLEGLLNDFKLTRAAREDILKLDGVSGVQLEAALKAAKLSEAKTRKERDAVVVQAVRRSQKALGRDITAKMKPSATHYSLDYLNTSGRFGPKEILQCLKNNPKGALVFYGLPGTGKTQFVEYMAAELGMPLVSKKASDLLSKWLGESEKNIAAAFEEAANEDAILLLDEGDSFLRDRSQARESWQVSQVNELLQHIERFDGIVVVCTNLFSGLDSAALRRFTFKVEFRELDVDQRWEMFQGETGLKGKLNTVERATRDAWFEQLVMMRRLTAGDFSTVKRQCTMLGTTLTPEGWLVQLQLECDVKRSESLG